MYGIISGIYRDMGVNSFAAPILRTKCWFSKKGKSQLLLQDRILQAGNRPHGPPSESASVSPEQFRDHLDIDSIRSSLMGSNRTNRPSPHQR